MSLFDNIICKYPLPENVKQCTFQTKDTPAQYLDQYEISEDGKLWHEAYDIEDRSDPNAKGLMGMRGLMTCVNKRWERCDTFTGEIVFYGFANEKEQSGWVEFSAYFVGGNLQQINTIENRQA